MSEQPLTLRETARGVAVRAGVLVIGGIVIGGWFTAMLFKAASGLMKILIGALLALITGGILTYEVKRVQKRLAAP